MSLAGVRGKARQVSSAATPVGNTGLVRAAVLLRSALSSVGIDVLELPADDSNLCGARAVLDRVMGVVWLSSALPAQSKPLALAHELGHIHLHAGYETAWHVALDGGVDGVAGDYIAYSPAALREVEAQAFALEFLLPRDRLLAAFIDGASFRGIAAAVGLPDDLVLQQLATHCLSARPVADTEDGTCRSAPAVRVAHGSVVHADGPLAAIAPAGAGKTVALLARAIRLIESGVRPGSIAMLAFTRRSAEDLRDRLSATGVPGAVQVEVFTHHGLAMELVRQWGTAHGIPRMPAARVLDRGPEVARCIHGALAECGHSEDEMLPAFAGLLSDARVAGVSPRQAAKWLADRPVAHDGWRMAPEDFERVYRAFDEGLKRLGIVDFDGILVWACDLLETVPGMAEAVREQWPHVLLDEFQDANAATWRLVALVAGEGRGLVGVADLCQSIYSFRQADDPLGHYRRAYPAGVVEAIRGGFRCGEAIARVCGALAADVDPAGADLWSGEARCGEACVDLTLCDDEAAIMESIGRAIRDAEAGGIALGRQAVLCPTNAQTNDVAEALMLQGIAVAHTGRPLTRPEVRDICCLLLGEPADLVMSSARRGRLSAAGGSMTLVGTPSERLSDLLFGGGECLRPLLGNDRPDTLVARAALGRLYRSAIAFSSCSPGVTDEACRQFVEALLVPETGTPQSAGRCDDAGDLNAVAVLTIHSAKGLEFDAVHVPYVGVPENGRHDDDLVAARSDCALLYVAASRASRRLHFYRPRAMGGRPARPLEALAHLDPLIREGWVAEIEGVRAVPRPGSPQAGDLVDLSDLDSYGFCPRKHYYQSLTPEMEWGNQSTAVTRTLREVAYACMEGGVVGQDAAAELAVARLCGAMRRPTEGIVADVRRAAAAIALSPPPGAPRLEVTVELEDEVVRFPVDAIVHEQGRMVLEAFVAARLDRSMEKPRLSMLFAAAQGMEAGEPVVVRVRDLLGGGAREARPSARIREHLADYARHLAGLRSGAFPVRRGKHCRTCAFRMQCPDLGDGALAAGKLRQA